MLRNFMALCVLVLLAGCGSMKPQDFAQKEPRFDVFEYFEGNSRAWGIFEDRFGKLRRQFTVDITGTVNDGVLTLEEDFLYDDGEQDRRVWTIRKTGEHSLSGEADDIIGTAAGVLDVLAGRRGSCEPGACAQMGVRDRRGHPVLYETAIRAASRRINQPSSGMRA